MGSSPLIHSNESHLIDTSKIQAATKKMIESLSLAAGSTEGFDIYKVVEVYFIDLEKRHEINRMLGIVEDPSYYGEQEQVQHEEKD